MMPVALALVALLAGPIPGIGEEGGALPPVSDQALVPSYPPCFEVTLTADASGRPPLTYTWTLPDGTTLDGNPVILDTALLPPGWNEVRLDVTNSAGSAEWLYQLVVETLAFSAPPSFTVDGLTVHARANTTGATEWRWSWGDGSLTDWTSGCDGYELSHTYAAQGDYPVTIEARSCREQGALARATVHVGTTLPATIDRFQAVCPTEPFCSFSVGDVVAFDVVVSGITPDAYLYDWNGDGLDDQVAAQPVTVHVFEQPGTPIPRLTILAGTASDTAFHPAPIEILASPDTSPVFSDGFESGDLSRWSAP